MRCFIELLRGYDNSRRGHGESYEHEQNRNSTRGPTVDVSV
jgi:hypothetical protein